LSFLQNDKCLYNTFKHKYYKRLNISHKISSPKISRYFEGEIDRWGDNSIISMSSAFLPSSFSAPEIKKID